MTEKNGKQSGLNPVLRIDELHTSASFLELKPVIDALTTTRQGRMAVVQDGFKQGIFNDFRTFEYLDRGLGDKYSELADYIERTIIPSIGEKMLPFIKNNFRKECREGEESVPGQARQTGQSGQAGKTGQTNQASQASRTEDVRRFRLLYQLKDKDLHQTINAILEGSAVDLQAEAVSMLADNVANEALIIQLADDKHKPVRESAYCALAQLNTKTSLEKLLHVFLNNKNKANLGGIVVAIKLGKMSFFLEDVYKKIRADFEAFCSMGIETEDKQLVAALDKLSTELTALENKKEDYIIRFQEECITDDRFNRLINKKKSLLGSIAQDIAESIFINFGYIGNDASHQALKRLFDHPYVRKNWWEYVAIQYFPVAAQAFGKEQMYDLFNPCFKEDKLSTCMFISTYAEGTYGGHDTFTNVFLDSEKLDKRWLDLFLKAGEKKWEDNPELIFLLISCAGVQNEYSRKALKEYMEEVIKNKRLSYHPVYIYMTDKLMESGLSQRFELFTASLENNKYPNYDFGIYKHISEAAYIKDFPKEYAKRFDALYKKSNMEYYRDIAQKIAENQGKFQLLINKIIK
jgi:hypothetical protein